ncbi:hypothetical protein P154DRAFT_414118, partial [Amniculicola lignicola CBS 123094]
PLLSLIFLIFSTTSILGFSASNSRWRLVTLILQAANLCYCVSTCMPNMVRMLWASMVGGYAVSFYLQYIDVAILGGCDFEARGPVRRDLSGLVGREGLKEKEKKKQAVNLRGVRTDVRDNRNQSNLITRLNFGWNGMTNWRHVGTPHSVKNIPPFSSSNAACTPSRGQFLLRTLSIFAISYLILDILAFSSDQDITIRFFSIDKIPIFRRDGDPVTLEELFIRSFATISLGIGMNAVQRGTYSIVAFLSVASGLSEPISWPPFYGSYSDIYSIRNLWGVFWHQTNTHRVSALSHFSVHDTLRLPRGNMIVRYLRALTTLYISGVQHLIIDLSAGVGVKESGAIQFVGIVIEDTVIAIWK